MTDNEIIEEIARLDGWNNGSFEEGAAFLWLRGDERTVVLPDYLGNRDAILSVIQKQSKTTQINVVISVWQASCINHDDSWTTEDIVDIIFCTPKEYCVALLKVKRKWKE